MQAKRALRRGRRARAPCPQATLLRRGRCKPDGAQLRLGSPLSTCTPELLNLEWARDMLAHWNHQGCYALVLPHACTKLRMWLLVLLGAPAAWPHLPGDACPGQAAAACHADPSTAGPHGTPRTPAGPPREPPAPGWTFTCGSPTAYLLARRGRGQHSMGAWQVCNVSIAPQGCQDGACRRLCSGEPLSRAP